MADAAKSVWLKGDVALAPWSGSPRRRDVWRSMKLFRGGDIVSAAGITRADLVVDGEKIQAVGTPGSVDTKTVDEVIDASGTFVMPGLIDPHLHFNSPFMGTTTVHDYPRGTAAAAFGGVTTIIDFSTQPKGGSLLANIAQKEEEARDAHNLHLAWFVSTCNGKRRFSHSSISHLE